VNDHEFWVLLAVIVVVAVFCAWLIFYAAQHA
jgi:hypothetical protein